MTQHLYNEQDNQNLNAQIEATVKPVAEETPVAARGQNSSINHIDELAFFVPEESAPAVKIQQSSAFGSHAQPDAHERKVRSFTEGGIEAVQKATNIIDPTTGMPNAFHLSPEMIRQAQAQVQEGGAVMLGGDGSSKMFNNIKDMFVNNVKPSPKTEVYFVDNNKSKVQFGIDQTIFEPSPSVRLSPKAFEVNYLKQLESYIFNSKEELDPEKLFSLIYLVGFIREGHFPIKLVSAKHRIQMPKIVKTLNLYFNKNHSVIFGIAQMFNGMTAMPQATDKKAE